MKTNHSDYSWNYFNLLSFHWVCLIRTIHLMEFYFQNFSFWNAFSCCRHIFSQSSVWGFSSGDIFFFKVEDHYSLLLFSRRRNGLTDMWRYLWHRRNGQCFQLWTFSLYVSSIAISRYMPGNAARKGEPPEGIASDWRWLHRLERTENVFHDGTQNTQRLKHEWNMQRGLIQCRICELFHAPSTSDGVHDHSLFRSSY